MKTINRFLHFELSPRQLMIGTCIYFTLILLVYAFCMYWVLSEILNRPSETVKVVGPVVVGYHIHRKFSALFKQKK